MRQTQIYLTEKQRKAIKAISEQLGETPSEVIRRAVDRYIVRYQSGNRLELLREARGMWSHRNDLPDFRGIREEFDRV